MPCFFRGWQIRVKWNGRNTWPYLGNKRKNRGVGCLPSMPNCCGSDALEGTRQLDTEPGQAQADHDLTQDIGQRHRDGAGLHQPQGLQ